MRTTSCGPSASAPLPVHAGETSFHWLRVREQRLVACDPRPAGSAAAFVAAAVTGCGVWADTQVSEAEMSVHPPPPPSFSPLLLVFLRLRQV